MIRYNFISVLEAVGVGAFQSHTSRLKTSNINRGVSAIIQSNVRRAL